MDSQMRKLLEKLTPAERKLARKDFALYGDFWVHLGENESLTYVPYKEVKKLFKGLIDVRG